MAGQPRPPGSDATLLSLIRSGDPAAASVLHERHAPAARTLASLLTTGPDEAEAVVAESFRCMLGALRRRAGPTEAFRPHLLAVVAAVAGPGGRPPAGTAPGVQVPGPGHPFIAAADAGTGAALIVRAFLALPERWGAALWHAEIELGAPAAFAPFLGMSASAAAALTGCARDALRAGYLQLYRTGAADPGCRTVADDLAAWARRTLARSGQVAVDEHLSSCGPCWAAYTELIDIGAALRGSLAPLVLGRAAAAYCGQLAGLPPAAAAQAAPAVPAAGAVPVAGAGPVVPAAGGGPAAVVPAAVAADAAAPAGAVCGAASRPGGRCPAGSRGTGPACRLARRKRAMAVAGSLLGVGALTVGVLILTARSGQRHHARPLAESVGPPPQVSAQPRATAAARVPRRPARMARQPAPAPAMLRPAAPPRPSASSATSAVPGPAPSSAAPPAGRPACPATAAADISADCYAASQGTISVTPADGASSPAHVDGDQVAQLGGGDWLEYPRISFGAGSSQFDMQVASGAPAGVSGLVEVVLDNPSNAPVGTISVATTGGWSDWKTIPGGISETAGTHTVYLEFASGSAAPFVSLHYFSFPAA